MNEYNLGLQEAARERFAREKASDHWEWLVQLLELVYVDSFVHGFGHGVEWEMKRQQIEAQLESEGIAPVRSSGTGPRW